MSATSILLVATSIVAVDGGMATIGAGEAQLLEPGDHGLVYYELTVNGEPRRIDVGPFVVATVAADTSSIAAELHTILRVGYEVEVRLPISRQDKRLEPAAPRDAVDISSGHYAIGLDPSEAQCDERYGETHRVLRRSSDGSTEPALHPQLHETPTAQLQSRISLCRRPR